MAVIKRRNVYERRMKNVSSNYSVQLLA